jgi:DNA-nicking Smr family endonuclease
LHHCQSFLLVIQHHVDHGNVPFGLALYVSCTLNGPARIAITSCTTPFCSTHSTDISIPALNHSSADTEAEYDRLRDLARQEAGKRGACFDKAHQAYESGDGARAHQLSEEGKQHAAKMEQYNRQARDYIFRANNTNGRVDGDTIDLHGLFVEEAEDVLEERIKAAKSRGETHLHVIVGKGNHSTNHVQKIKPRVEQVCRELGLQYRTEANEGRMYVDLTGGNVDHMPPPPSGYAGYPGGQHGGGQQHGGQQHGGQQHHGGQQQHGGQHQQQGQNDEIEQMVKKGLPKLLKKLGCCTVM